MKSLRLILTAALLALPLVAATSAKAQVAVGVDVGPEAAPAPDYGPPDCAWGYYPVYPYACAPYGYYASTWFVGGVFIGTGPWYGWYYRHPYWGYRSYYGYRGRYGYRGGYGYRGRDGDRDRYGYRDRYGDRGGYGNRGGYGGREAYNGGTRPGTYGGGGRAYGNGYRGGTGGAPHGGFNGSMHMSSGFAGGGSHGGGGFHGGGGHR